MAVKILTLSNKPNLLKEARASVKAQTRKATHVVMVDKGRDWGGRYPPAVYYNEAAQACGMGDYISWLSDDDLLMPNYVETLAGYLDDHPDAGACYGFSEHWIYDAEGMGRKYRILPPDGICHTFAVGGIDPLGVIDGGQFMVRRSVLDAVGYPYVPENSEPSIARLSDGLLMRRIAACCGIVPVGPIFILQNRTNPWSSHCIPSSNGGIDAADWRRVR